MEKRRHNRFGQFRRLGFEQLESRRVLSITINSNEIWDGVSNPHAADGVTLVAGAYTIPTGITIGAGVTIFLDDPAPLPGDPASNSISWTFAPGAGGLTFINATSSIDVSRGGRNLSPTATFTINMNDNPIGGAIAGAGRIINGPYVTGGGATGDTMSVVINSQTDVVLGAIDIRVNDAASGVITISSQGLVDVDKLANADTSAGGGSTRDVNVTGETLVLGDIDTRGYRVEASVGNINLYALAQPANSVSNGSGNSAAINTITLNGAVNTNGPPVTIQPGGSLNLTATKVVLAPTFSVNLSENGDFNVTTGTTGNGFTAIDVFVNNTSVTPDTLNFAVAHDLALPAYPGDANRDGIVNAADYVVWRNTVGSQIDLCADFDHSGTVDTLDYGVWRAHFGEVAPPPDPPNSVTNYGATPNDSNYDEAAIQSAINANTSVYFPPGEYWLNSKLVIPAGRTLYGPKTGAQAVLRVRFDTGVNADNYAMEIVGNDVVIQNLVIDKDFIDGSYGVGIIANNRSNITISGVEIRDYSVRYGIHLIECSDFRITNCYVHDFMMNQSNPNGNEADMIQDSPAGIRITRSINGVISDSRVHNIEVGPLGRSSISELVPSYGMQGYQSDCITLSDVSGITVENNDLWNSGELVDTIASDNCIVRNNTMQMGWALGIKSIGAEDCIYKDNYIADCAIGLILVDHTQTGAESIGNLVDGNDFVNCGSLGIWNIAASIRMPYSTSGIYIDNNASGNTVTNNRIYNYHGYLPQYIRTGTGTNTVANNSFIATEFGPGGGGNAAVLGDWTAGLTHTKELIALNRALVFFTYAEDDSANISVTAVTYGGRSLSKITEQLTTEGARRVYVAAWILKQDAINTATNDSFNVTWNSTPDSVGYSSVFLANIYQTSPLYSWNSVGATSGNTISASPRVTHNGDIALYAATAAEEGDYTPNNGYIEALEVAIAGADGTAGFKLATGINETASVTHTNLETGSLSSVVLRKNPAAVFSGTTVDITTLGAFANDGVNDAVVLQNALNNPAYKEVYLPPGVYHFDRTVFVPSNKSVRGDNYATTEVRTLADIIPFRFDHVTGASIANFTITRPQTQDSNAEIIRGDYSSFITVDSIRVVNAGSRAPIILMQYGSYNRVSRCSIYDYQVKRTEPSPENPNNQLQVFGSGITFTGETDITITDCKVVQNTYLSVPSPIIKGWHQSSAIQVPICVGGTVARNYVYQTGQGIDTSGGSYLIIADNFIEQIHSAGIKLVNGSNNNLIEDNYLRNCGLTGIWVSVGVQGNGGSYENIVRNNTLVGIGKGIGLDFWDFNFGASTPAAIHLQAAKIITDRVRDNIIRSNRTYDNGEQRGVVVAEPAQSSDPYGAINNSISDNVAETSIAPDPPSLSGFLD